MGHKRPENSVEAIHTDEVAGSEAPWIVILAPDHMGQFLKTCPNLLSVTVYQVRTKQQATSPVGGIKKE